MSNGPPHGPPGIDPNFNLAPRLLGATYATTALGTILILLRLYTKAALVKNVGLDDIVLIFSGLCAWATAALVQASCNWGLGRHIYFLPPQNIVEALKWISISQPLGVLVGMLGRVSFAITLLRLPGPYDQLKKAVLYFIILEQILINVVFDIIQFCQCGSQVNGIWDPSVAAKAHCWPRSVVNDFGIFVSSSSVATDLALTIIPLWIIWDMQLKLAIKISLASLLGMSIFAMATTIVKTVEVEKVNESPDITVATANLFIWAELEGVMVILAASMAALKPLFRKIAPSAVTSSVGKAYKVSSHRFNPGRHGLGDFEMLPKDNMPYQEKRQNQERSRHTSWYYDGDDAVVPKSTWEDEERRVLRSLEHLPAPEPPPKSPTQLSYKIAPDHDQKREPRIVV